MGMADQDEAGNEQEAQDDKAEEEENPDEDEIFCEPCGEAPIIIARSPGCPTHEEIEHHNVTHLPYRSWCPVCVQARGKEDDHRRNKKKPEETVPTIVMDYKAFGQDEKDTKLTSIVIRDKRTTMTAMHVCLCKGMEDRWIVDAILEDIANMGYTNIILKTDGEPALVQVATEVKKRRAHPTVLQHPPAYDPDANGGLQREQFKKPWVRCVHVKSVSSNGRESKLRPTGQSWSGWPNMQGIQSIEASLGTMGRLQTGG